MYHVQNMPLPIYKNHKILSITFLSFIFNFVAHNYEIFQLWQVFFKWTLENENYAKKYNVCCNSSGKIDEKKKQQIV